MIVGISTGGHSPMGDPNGNFLKLKKNGKVRNVFKKIYCLVQWNSEKTSKIFFELSHLLLNGYFLKFHSCGVNFEEQQMNQGSHI